MGNEKETNRLFNQLTQDSFLMVNKKLTQIYGIQFAGILNNLIDKYKYFHNRGMDEEGWFFVTDKQQMQQMGISIHTLKKTRESIKTFKFIQIKRKGIPAKLFYKVNTNKLLDFLENDIDLTFYNNISKISITGYGKFLQLIMENIDNYIRITDNKKNREKEKKTSVDDDTEIFPKKQIKQLLPKIKYITPSQFEMFYKAYPKKVGRGDAEKAWNKLCRLPNKDPKPTLKQLLIAIKAHKKTKQWQNKQFIPGPSPWLNSKKWKNEIEGMNYERPDKDNFRKEYKNPNDPDWDEISERSHDTKYNPEEDEEFTARSSG